MLPPITSGGTPAVPLSGAKFTAKRAEKSVFRGFRGARGNSWNFRKKRFARVELPGIVGGYVGGAVTRMSWAK